MNSAKSPVNILIEASQVLLEGVGEPLRASGVEFVQRGKTLKIENVRQEVILSAGECAGSGHNGNDCLITGRHDADASVVGAVRHRESRNLRQARHQDYGGLTGSWREFT